MGQVFAYFHKNCKKFCYKNEDMTYYNNNITKIPVAEKKTSTKMITSNT